MAQPSDFTVLIVDDEADILTFLRTALEDAGFRVRTATNGREALQAVEKEKPDFISLDLVMPGGSGIAFLHQLRRAREWRNIPVMVVTGHAQDDLGRADLQTALEGKLLSGPHAYLEKPITPESYVAAVCHALQVFPPAQAGGGSFSGEGHREIAERLKNATPEQIEEILRLLRR